MDDEAFQRLIALFWASFGTGAQMPFDSACIDIASADLNVTFTALGYYRNVRNGQWSGLKVDEAMRCCKRAGHLAAYYALAKGRDTISVEDFRNACLKVQAKVAKVRARAAARGDNNTVTILGAICG